MKKIVLISAIVFVSIASACVLWARSTGRLDVGDVSPIFGILTMVMIAVSVWASRVRPTSAKVD
ncbi:hypothetical protein [Brevundimonas goettingensis]|uniref:Lipoprotein n=1 Tax=Brevundimonas goettingensis TaxID=2774190 RepID=A0A975C2X9_9CAUL|nr:hypothetical protein [Brevundimonas goettingensis]QTC90351.1 hypothetical protein IFJ75_13845 [Brevundimonas goettingensis]